MQRIEQRVLNNIPEDQIDEIVDMFLDDGAMVQRKPDESGRFTVIAEYQVDSPIPMKKAKHRRLTALED